MCGIAGAISLNGRKIPELAHKLDVMDRLMAHRGPDGNGKWQSETDVAGFAHRRLAIIDVATGQQPMRDDAGNVICYNGEVYNYVELREELGQPCKTSSDTEVILHAYEKWGEACVDHLYGMFAFAIWDARRQELFLARDRYGIKPLYLMQANGVLYFASEIKSLLPYAENIAVNKAGFSDYLTFQFCLDGKTLFEGIRELRPAHCVTVRNGVVDERRYWQVYYEPDFYHTEKYFQEKLEECLQNSIKYHIRSDVPLGGYISGGVDSSIVASIANDELNGEFMGFTGKFSIGKEYDESEYARLLAHEKGFPLEELDITAQDFIDNIRKVIYHLDYPVAGPGSFSQYMISSHAAKFRKVVLGGQGGDEIFGGYTRYLVAYFEQCIKGAIDGTMESGNFVVTYQSIIPNLRSLHNYKPMLKEFWSSGLFDEPDKRYFALVNRAPRMGDSIRWDNLGAYSPYETFRDVFLAKNVNKKSYFDSMTHFDFKTLLPALLHIEDRMSMAHGIESRVPFLDQSVVELAATMPADVKFKDGNMKYVLRESMKRYVPGAIMNRKDKMGFPTPFNRWAANEARDFVFDVFSTDAAKTRELVDNENVRKRIGQESNFSRNVWGLFCLELWQQEFIDQAEKFRRMA